MRGALQCDNIHQGQPDCPWMDKLLPYREYEGIHWQVWTVAETQDKGHHTQAVEEAFEDIQEPHASEQEASLPLQWWEDICSGQHSTGIVQAIEWGCRQLSAQSWDTGH